MVDEYTVRLCVQALFEEIQRQEGTGDPERGGLGGLGRADHGKTVLDGAYDLDAMVREVFEAASREYEFHGC